MRRNVSVDSSLTPDILNIQVSNKSKNLTLTKSTNIIYKTTNGDELYLALRIPRLCNNRKNVIPNVCAWDNYKG